MKKTLLLSLIAFFFIACKKDDGLNLPDGTPDCIRKEIKSFKKHAAICDGYKVSSFDTQIGKLYFFSNGNCIADEGERYLDVDCNEVCYISGWGSECLANFDTLVFENETILWSN